MTTGRPVFAQYARLISNRFTYNPSGNAESPAGDSAEKLKVLSRSVFCRLLVRSTSHCLIQEISLGLLSRVTRRGLGVGQVTKPILNESDVKACRVLFAKMDLLHLPRRA